MTSRFAKEDANLVFPPRFISSPADKENLDVWGFTDSGFEVMPDGNVHIKGERYAAGGDVLDKLLPWVRDVMEVDIRGDLQNPPNYPPTIPDPIKNPSLIKALTKFLSSEQLCSDSEVRLRHGHGHTQEDMYSIKYGEVKRIPDLVVYPDNEEDVAAIVKAVGENDACLIPYGGGTNVTAALQCPEDEKRCIVSVDMKGLNRIHWIDTDNHMACIEAGAVGRNIFSQLKEYGFTIGHEPDSVEFSTLGGWVATNASGMKKNRYGNIEDIVLDFNVVTADGIIERHDLNPRESIGSDPRTWLFGSEGNFGIVTSVVVKLFPLPESEVHGSVLFPDFDAGYRFMKEITRAGVIPASVRLVDNLQFQLSQALKPTKIGLPALKSQAEKLLVTKALGFNPQKMCACTLVFEGSRSETEAQQKSLYQIAKKHGGMKAGAENGKRGYQLTFAIAYIRDFIMNHYLIAESFETSVPWSKLPNLVASVKQRLHDECAARGIPGKPFVTARITQVYPTGAAVYFYFAFYYKGIENPSALYAEIEHAAREEILSCGGSLSHHHGIGKLRESFLPQILSPTALQWKRKFKDTIDPKHVFAVGNQALRDQ
jgi:alkyldihydroxyacetonephosphate synthase